MKEREELRRVSGFRVDRLGTGERVPEPLVLSRKELVHEGCVISMGR
jgi:hypothetical protein